MIKFNLRTGTLKDPYPQFSLSSFLGEYCYTEKGIIKYFDSKEQAMDQAIKYPNVAVKPVQSRYVLIINLL